MFRRVLHTICSLWLVALLVFGVTPKDAIHACSDHQDTVHQYDVEGPVVDAAHHHCSFLSFELMPFAAPILLPGLRPVHLAGFETYQAIQDERACQQAVMLREGRGPPVFI